MAGISMHDTATGLDGWALLAESPVNPVLAELTVKDTAEPADGAPIGPNGLLRGIW